MIHYMSLLNDSFQSIKEGLKTVELRLNDEKRQSISIGDRIKFLNKQNNDEMLVMVTSIDKYSNFEVLYRHHSKESIGYKKSDISNFKDMFTYYTIEQIEKYGVLAIGIMLVTTEDKNM